MREGVEGKYPLIFFLWKWTSKGFSPVSLRRIYHDGYDNDNPKKMRENYDVVDSLSLPLIHVSRWKFRGYHFYTYCIEFSQMKRE